ncbi:MAG: hypothetical protein E4H27_04905 [Anaerolineales bacterium]|nr:MAG: hypothetical protein E4H27_04905 [Anaerolineales bacterium]
MTAQLMPTVPLGPHTISRLILGANPINGGSHLSRFVNNQMKHYFTENHIMDILANCESLGINTWQSGPGNLPQYQAYINSGGKMHYIALAQQSESMPDMLEKLAEAGTIGVAHHGEVTDVFWKTGQMDKVHEYTKHIRDSGMLVGVSTHIPDVVDYIVSAGWDVDFFMCCVYERHRTPEELKAMLGHIPLPLKEVYLTSDPPRMYRAMRQTDIPCLAFKILAAGRLCDQQEWVEQAFEEAFSEIKVNDAVIVGMYPEYEDQPALNAALVKRFSHLSQG